VLDHEFIFFRSEKTLKESEFCPVERVEFGPSKFFSKKCKFFIIFNSIWQFPGGAIFKKHADPGKKNQNSRKSRANRKEENLYGHCAMNNARRILSKGFTLSRGCWFWSKKLLF